MEKKTLLAIVFSIIIVIAGGVMQFVFFPPAKNSINNQQVAQTTTLTETEKKNIDQNNGKATDTNANATIITPKPLDLKEEQYNFANSNFNITFNNKGADVTTLKLNNYKEADGTLVDMVHAGATGQLPFNIVLNSTDGTGYDTKDIIFELTKQTSTELEFKRDFDYNNNGEIIPFTLKKNFIFKDNEYLMEVRVSLITENNKVIPIKNYTLTYGPQIGPKYNRLDGQNEYRKLVYYSDGKVVEFKHDSKAPRKKIEDRILWQAIEGKYFVVSGISYVNGQNAVASGFDTSPIGNVRDVNSIYYDRTINESTKIDDGYKFYIGPKLDQYLAGYNKSETNSFGESGLSLDKMVQGDMWGWLSAILKWPLDFFYMVTKNWGVAIILLTALIKILFFPLTHKSTESTKKMQALGPKLEELKAKYKNDPQRMNQEMAALYKKEGINPLGGCLPLLLQLPIFFALYSLFSNYFAFRGAPFIPGWISDLSAPEKIASLPAGMSVPFLGWTDFNLLPFIMVGITYLQQVTAGTSAQGNQQMKMMMYLMPIFFFFIMYNMPSGLLLYWTMQNIFTVLQQVFTNYIKPKLITNVASSQR